MHKYKAGFTLAEVLITLGIIGVVAAMTIPTLLTNVSNNIFAVRIKQVYYQLSSAIITYMSDNDIVQISPKNMKDYSPDSEEIAVNNLIRKNFKNAIMCEYPSPKCFGETYVINNQTEWSDSYRGFWRENSSFLLNNGSSVSIVSMGGEDSRFRVVIDVNNNGFPNKIGRDLWIMYIANNGALTTNSSNKTCDKDYEACLQRLIDNNWKLDF